MLTGSRAALLARSLQHPLPSKATSQTPLVRNGTPCVGIPGAGVSSIAQTGSYATLSRKAPTLVADPTSLPRELLRRVRSARLFSTDTSSTGSSGNAVLVKPKRSSPKWDLKSMFTPGSIHHGFCVVDAQSHPALNLDLYVLRHLKSGALYLHVDRDDYENAFCLGFRTTPRDDSGIAHILEHTTLCGSEKYPVRDPFFLLMRRSLNTFMNAMTRPECTYYPFATQNEKDFDNLLSVYLDACFFPNLAEQDFAQEGHRLDVVRTEEGAEDNHNKYELVYKGVVFNEMKGALSDPSSQFISEMEKYLYPTAIYRHNSGGDPLAIPSLTHEGLKAFHALHYHPSNAIFMTYGDLNPRLQEIDEVCNRKMARLESQGQTAYEVPPPDAPTPFESAGKLTMHGTRPHPRITMSESTKTTSLSGAEQVVGTVLPPEVPPAVSAIGALSHFGQRVEDTQIPPAAANYPAPRRLTDLTRERSRFSRPRGVVTTGPDNSLIPDLDKQSRFAITWLGRESVTDIMSPSLLSSFFVNEHAPQNARESEVSLASVNPGGTNAEGVTPDTYELAQSSIDQYLTRPLKIDIMAEAHRFREKLASNPDELADVAESEKELEAELEKARAYARSLTPAQRAQANEALEDLGISILSAAIFEAQSPVYDIINDPELGTGPAASTGVETSLGDYVFSLGIQNCPKNRIPEIAERLLKALEDIAVNGTGLDRKKLLGLLHRVELSTKKGSSNFGVRLLMNLVPIFAHNRDIQSRVGVVSLLPLLRHAINTYGNVYFRALLAHHVLENPHRLHFIQHADRDFNKRLIAKEKEQLAQIQASLTPEQVKEIEARAAELQARQEAGSDPECLPKVTIDDVSRQSNVYDTRYSIHTPAMEPPKIEGIISKDALGNNDRIGTINKADAENKTVIAWGQEPTNGIVYLRGSVEGLLDRLRARDIIPLMFAVELFGQLGVAGRSYEDHQLLISCNTGGVDMAARVEHDYAKNPTDPEPTLRLRLASHALTQKTTRLAQILGETALAPDFTARFYDRLVRFSGTLSSDATEAPQRLAKYDAAARLPDAPTWILSNVMGGIPLVRSVRKFVDRMTADVESTLGKQQVVALPDQDQPVEGAEVGANLESVGAAESEGVDGDESVDVADEAEESAVAVNTAKAALETPSVVAFSRVMQDLNARIFAPGKTGSSIDRMMLSFDEQSQPQARETAYAFLKLMTSAPKPTALDGRSNPEFEAKVQAAMENLYQEMDAELVRVARLPDARTLDNMSVRDWLEVAVNAINEDAAKTKAGTAGVRTHNYIALPIQINHCIMVFKSVLSSHPDAPALAVLAKYLTDGFLHREIREKGGAYGGGARFDGGVFTLSSFRDPRVEGTLEDFKRAIEWASKPENMDLRVFEESRLSVLADMDAPVLPSRRGLESFFSGIPPDMNQKFRDAIFACKPEDLLRVLQTHFDFATARVAIAGAGDNIPAAIEASAASPDGVWTITRFDE